MNRSGFRRWFWGQMKPEYKTVVFLTLKKQVYISLLLLLVVYGKPSEYSRFGRSWNAMLCTFANCKSWGLKWWWSKMAKSGWLVCCYCMCYLLLLVCYLLLLLLLLLLLVFSLFRSWFTPSCMIQSILTNVWGSLCLAQGTRELHKHSRLLAMNQATAGWA